MLQSTSVLSAVDGCLAAPISIANVLMHGVMNGFEDAWEGYDFGSPPYFTNPGGALFGKADSSSSITLSWQAPYEQEVSSYFIYQNNAPMPVGSTGKTTYTINGLEAGKTYSFYVTASNKYGESSPTNTIKAFVVPAPKDITWTGTSSTITLTWPIVSPETGTARDYEIFRGQTPVGNFTSVGTSTTTSFTENQLQPSTYYYYKVSATVYDSNGGTSGTSSQSGVVTAKTMIAAPTGLNAAASGTGITVTWSSVSGAASYNIYRSESSSGTYTKVGTSTTASYTDNSVQAGTTYYYKVAAYNTEGESDQSSFVSSSGGEAGMTWTTIADGLTFDTLYSVAYGGGMFVAHDSNMAEYSSDGIHWTRSDYGTGAGKIAYGGGKFVIGGGVGNMMVSTDGMTYTYVQNHGFSSFDAIAYGNGVFVAGGGKSGSADLMVAWSEDGLTWHDIGNTIFTANPPPPEFGGTYNSINGIAYGGDKFIVVVNGYVLGYSPNGKSWTYVRKDVLDYGADAITYGNGMFVAVGYQDEDESTFNYYQTKNIAYSRNGLDWTDAACIRDTLNAVVWGKDKFVAVGDSTSQMVYSSDGINWTIDTTNHNSNLNGIAYGNGKFVAVGGDVVDKSIGTVSYANY